MSAVMKVFAGPPGTGKTWRAAREAVRILAPNTSPAQVQEIHEKLVREGRIIWVTFHPSYSYEDFVEGFRPEETEAGNITYSIIPGPFLRACRTASAAVSPNRFHVGQHLGKYEVTHVEAGGLVLRATGNNREDAVTEDATGFVDFWTLQRFAEHNRPASDLRIPGKLNEKKKEVARIVGLPTTFFNNSSRHAAVYDALLDGGVTPAPTPTVLVIDELNRADLSRVFGELITLLEFDKRQGASEERAVTLAYSGRPLSVPAELSIIGTMNTADKSLSTVDLALRRRFEFVLIPPEPKLTPESYGGVNVRKTFNEMNRRLAALNGHENLIGHSDFMINKLEELRVREDYDPTVEGQLKAFAHTLRLKTVPFLVDLFRADWNSVRFVVGRALFEQEDLSDLQAELEDFGIPESVGVIVLANWWDPSRSWDGARFSATLGASRGPNVSEMPSAEQISPNMDSLQSAGGSGADRSHTANLNDAPMRSHESLPESVTRS